MISKIDPSVGKLYTDALKKIDGPLTKVQRANLTKYIKPKFQKLVEKNGGDVVTSLNEYLKFVQKNSRLWRLLSH